MSDELIPKPRLKGQAEGETDAEFAERKAAYEERLAAYEAQQAEIAAKSAADVKVDPEEAEEAVESPSSAPQEPFQIPVTDANAASSPVTPLPVVAREADTKFAPWNDQEVLSLHRFQSDPTKEHYTVTVTTEGDGTEVRTLIPTNNGFIDPATGFVVQEWAHVAVFDTPAVVIPADAEPPAPVVEPAPVLEGEIPLPYFNEVEIRQLRRLLTFVAGNRNNCPITLVDKLRKPGGLADALEAVMQGKATIVPPTA